MYILGISCFYHDSAAALLSDGKIISAAQEERFTRKKHDPSFPKNAISYCISNSDMPFDDLDAIVFYEKPFLKFDRLLETYLAFAPRGFLSFSKSMPVWLRDKIFQRRIILQELRHFFSKDADLDTKLKFSEHHLSHAASAFYPSPFSEAAIITFDGVGEWVTTSISSGENEAITRISEMHFPHSLGLLYSAFTYHAGFKVNSGEYKLMGLAPYGEPIYTNKIYDNLLDLKDDGSFQLNMSYFDYCTGLHMTSKKFDRLFGSPARDPGKQLTKLNVDMAASIQKVTEDIVLKTARYAKKCTGSNNLCLAGGVALNCVANGVLSREKIFDRIWVQPAAGDAGGAIGGALAYYHQSLGHPRRPLEGGVSDGMSGAFLGPGFDSGHIESALSSCGATYRELSKDELISQVAGLISEGFAVGWFQGRMEFGPRALGARSILADPRSSTMQKRLNLKIKYRENFRPFAPCILEEDLGEWYEFEGDCRYMSYVANLKDNKRNGKIASLCISEELIDDSIGEIQSQIPAVTHVDYSSRVQTVGRETNSMLHSLLREFKKITGVPVLINTSFNVRGEPIVCTPKDAYRCFINTDIDYLVIENFLLSKGEQKQIIQGAYSERFELD